ISYISLYLSLFTTIISIFFFSCSVDHRDLHSFPTRRSSDLSVKFIIAFNGILLSVYLLLILYHFVRIIMNSCCRGISFSEKLDRSEEHTSELQSRGHLVCRLLLEKKNKKKVDKRNVKYK